MRTSRILAVVLHTVLATAQTSFETDMSSDSSRDSVSAALMNITFSDPNSSECGNSSSSSTLAIAIRTIPASQTCFNLGNTFSDPESTYSVQGGPCKDRGSCGVNYTITASDFGINVNYSQIFYTQIRNPFATNGGSTAKVGGRLEFEAFNGPNCQKKDGVKPRQWNCISSGGECTTLPFAVQSFAIAMTDPEHVGHSNCTVAEVSNGTARKSSMRTALIGAVGLVWLAVWL